MNQSDQFFNLKNLNDEDLNQLIQNISAHFSFMPNSSFKKNSDAYKEVFLKQEIADSVTFFGGSFNPFHLGHLECLKLCPEKNIVVVLDRNPHKEWRDIDQLFELQEVASKLINTPYSIYPGFWLSKKTNPTSEWITKVSISKINLLMGDDSFFHFLSWKEPEIILKRLTKLYIVPRIYQLIDLEEIAKECKKINFNLEIIFLDDHEYKHLSSTMLRK
jgi:nicotinate-nucleotide adenylyltransferase